MYDWETLGGNLRFLHFSHMFFLLKHVSVHTAKALQGYKLDSVVHVSHLVMKNVSRGVTCFLAWRNRERRIPSRIQIEAYCHDDRNLMVS